MTFGACRNPHRLAQARKIRAYRALQFAEQNAKRWAELVRKSLWSSELAVGCVETGKLYRSPYYAAQELGYRNHGNQVKRSAEDGRMVRGLRFVWLDKKRRRWTVRPV